jgi:hypothetical protein
MHLHNYTQEERFYVQYIKPLEKWSSYKGTHDTHPIKAPNAIKNKSIAIKARSTSNKETVTNLDYEFRNSVQLKLRSQIERGSNHLFFMNYQTSLLSKFRHYQKSVQNKSMLPALPNRNQCNTNKELRPKKSLHIKRNIITNQVKSMLQKITKQRYTSSRKLHRSNSDIKRKWRKFRTICDDDEDKMEVHQSLEVGNYVVTCGSR